MGWASLTPVLGKAAQAWSYLFSGSWGSSSTKPLVLYLQLNRSRFCKLDQDGQDGVGYEKIVSPPTVLHNCGQGLQSKLWCQLHQELRMG